MAAVALPLIASLAPIVLPELINVGKSIFKSFFGGGLISEVGELVKNTERGKKGHYPMLGLMADEVGDLLSRNLKDMARGGGFSSVKMADLSDLLQSEVEKLKRSIKSNHSSKDAGYEIELDLYKAVRNKKDKLVRLRPNAEDKRRMMEEKESRQTPWNILVKENIQLIKRELHRISNKKVQRRTKKEKEVYDEYKSLLPRELNKKIMSEAIAKSKEEYTPKPPKKRVETAMQKTNRLKKAKERRENETEAQRQNRLNKAKIARQKRNADKPKKPRKTKAGQLYSGHRYDDSDEYSEYSM